MYLYIKLQFNTQYTIQFNITWSGAGCVSSSDISWSGAGCVSSSDIANPLLTAFSVLTVSMLSFLSLSFSWDLRLAAALKFVLLVKVGLEEMTMSGGELCVLSWQEESVTGPILARHISEQSTGRRARSHPHHGLGLTGLTPAPILPCDHYTITCYHYTSR